LVDAEGYEFYCVFVRNFLY